MTEPAKPATPKLPEPEIIEILEQYMSPSMIIGLIVVGALVGAGVVLLWAYSNAQDIPQAPTTAQEPSNPWAQG